ncbi:hypothetical protein CL628_00490 [bacterium]|nr:hypothetical protein [bacterium]
MQFATVQGAVDAFEYPLVGIAHQDISVPKASAMATLREALLQRYTGPECWRGLWWLTCRNQPALFDQYTVVTMPKPSNAIVAGNHVFQMEWNATGVDARDMHSLRPDQRGQVHGAINDGKLRFPVNEFDHVLMRPVFAENNGRLGALMSVAAVQREAQRMESALHNFCYYQGPFIRMARGTRSAWSYSRNLVGRLGVESLEAAEFIGMTVSDISEARIQRRMRMLARMMDPREYLWDPIWAVSIPQWRPAQGGRRCPLVYGRRRIDYLCRVVHWIDDWFNVATIRTADELAGVA